VVKGSDLDSLALEVGSSAGRVAGIHELGTRGAGGTLDPIRPVNARALAIPLRDAMTPAGVPRRPSPRDWEDTFVISTPERSGEVEGLIVQDLGNGDLRFLYRLTAGPIEIPPRLGMRRRIEGLIEDYLPAQVDRIFRRRTSGG